MHLDTAHPNSPADLRRLVANLVAAYQQLEPYGIDSVSDYAEYLLEQALLGKRERRGTKGFDVLAPMYGRIQVKCRRLPSDGRLEQRLLCRNLDAEAFDYVGAIIFRPDLSVKCALLISRMAVWSFVENHPDTHKKIAHQQIAALNGAVDITERICRV